MIDSALFRRVALFSDLDPRELTVLSRAAAVRKYRAGDSILRADDAGDLFFVIAHGEVKVSVDSSDGREIVLSRLSSGDFFGEMALLENAPRSANVDAVTDTQIYTLRRTDFFNAIAKDYSMARKILSALSERLRRADEMIESLAHLDVSGRLARYFLRLAEERGGDPVAGYVGVQRPTQQEIANVIGASRETVSRMMRQLRDRDLIRTTGSTVYVRVDAPRARREPRPMR